MQVLYLLSYEGPYLLVTGESPDRNRSTELGERRFR